MKVKPAILFFCLTLMLLVKTREAFAVLINFDELVPDSLYASIDYPDVSFTNTAGMLEVRDAFPGLPFSGPNAILPQLYPALGNRNRASFTSGLDVDFISVVLGDFNEDADNIFLNAYDSNNVLLASTQDLLPDSLFGGQALSVSANSISYVEFWGQGDNENSVYFDNFEYRIADVNGSVIPEPATLSLFGLGLLAGWAFRRK